MEAITLLTHSRSSYAEDTNRNPECLRRMVIQRLEHMGMKKVVLPLGAAPDEPHLPILISENLETCKKVLILSPDSSGGNLGVWGIRQMQQDTINVSNLPQHSNVVLELKTHTQFGSMVDTVRHANEDGYAVVILNPSQTIWDYEAKTPMNFLSWKAKDKKTAALDPAKNSIPGNKTPENHVEYVFNNVLRPMVPKDAEIDVIAGGFSAYSIVKYLNSNCLYSPKQGIWRVY